MLLAFTFNEIEELCDECNVLQRKGCILAVLSENSAFVCVWADDGRKMGDRMNEDDFC
jgi:hypothetical protein